MKKFFDHGAFTATTWDGADKKARFANVYANFVLTDFQKSKFPEWFYKQLSQCFGMIAHFDLQGFYTYHFETSETKLRFLNQCLDYVPVGDPKFTYSDVERTLRAWIMEQDLIKKTVEQIRQEKAK